MIILTVILANMETLQKRVKYVRPAVCLACDTDSSCLQVILEGETEYRIIHNVVKWSCMLEDKI